MISRRGAFTGVAALAGPMSGCDKGQAQSPPQDPPAPLPALKSLAAFDLGVCLKTHDLKDEDWRALAPLHFDRITPEWEMKMEYMLRDDGTLRFDAPDQLLAFAHARDMAVFGHTLIWYAQDGKYFQSLKSDKIAFRTAYWAYIKEVAGYFRGKVTGWDVVNEPVTDEGAQLRTCLWSEMLGLDYIAIAYNCAHAADPDVPLFLNDYNLEYNPKKRATFLNLAEGLLKKGVPLHGLGTQTHIAADIEPGLLKAAINDLASLGLKVHISEIDISLKQSKAAPFKGTTLLAQQSRALDEITETYLALKPEQQFGMTFWALRDKDSWLNFKDGHPLTSNLDAPVLFDNKAQAKPLAYDLAKRLA